MHLNMVITFQLSFYNIIEQTLSVQAASSLFGYIAGYSSIIKRVGGISTHSQTSIPGIYRRNNKTENIYFI